MRDASSMASMKSGRRLMVRRMSATRPLSDVARIRANASATGPVASSSSIHLMRAIRLDRTGRSGELVNGHSPMDALFLRRIVASRQVIRAPVIPDHHVANGPFVPVLRIRLDHPLRQLVDNRVTFVRRKAFDAEDLARIEVQRLPSGFRMGTHDGMEHRFPIAMFGVQ